MYLYFFKKALHFQIYDILPNKGDMVCLHENYYISNSYLQFTLFIHKSKYFEHRYVNVKFEITFFSKFNVLYFLKNVKFSFFLEKEFTFFQNLKMNYILFVNINYYGSDNGLKLT